MCRTIGGRSSDELPCGLFLRNGGTTRSGQRLGPLGVLNGVHQHGEYDHSTGEDGLPIRRDADDDEPIRKKTDDEGPQQGAAHVAAPPGQCRPTDDHGGDGGQFVGRPRCRPGRSQLRGEHQSGNRGANTGEHIDRNCRELDRHTGKISRSRVATGRINPTPESRSVQQNHRDDCQHDQNQYADGNVEEGIEAPDCCRSVHW